MPMGAPADGDRVRTNRDLEIAPTSEIRAHSSRSPRREI